MKKSGMLTVLLRGIKQGFFFIFKTKCLYFQLSNCLLWCTKTKSNKKNTLISVFQLDFPWLLKSSLLVHLPPWTVASNEAYPFLWYRSPPLLGPCQPSLYAACLKTACNDVLFSNDLVHVMCYLVVQDQELMQPMLQNYFYHYHCYDQHFPGPKKCPRRDQQWQKHIFTRTMTYL